MKKETAKEWMEGYKVGQRKLAQAIITSSVESVGDLAYWLAKLKAIAEGKEDEFI